MPSTADQRRLMHLLYLELSGFTSAYLAHQLVEERVVMPAIEQAIGPEGALGVHIAIVSSIPPEEMARSLAFMLPAMNLDDRTEMLTGMKMSAPTEAFDAVTGWPDRCSSRPTSRRSRHGSDQARSCRARSPRTRRLSAT